MIFKESLKNIFLPHLTKNERPIYNKKKLRIIRLDSSLYNLHDPAITVLLLLNGLITIPRPRAFIVYLSALNQYL